MAVRPCTPPLPHSQLNSPRVRFELLIHHVALQRRAHAGFAAATELQCSGTQHKTWRWSSGKACERALQYTVGEKIHGFTVEQVTSVPELFLTAVKLSHDNTGAGYLHLAREDRNNTFSLQFRTTPLDNTGAAHVLEHAVFCGSQKYPCRDPFFKMKNRSLSTFMNAITDSDNTRYPFSTQNAKDFQNLLSVYLDATFFPCLRELDFWYEGWRLAHENPSDPNSPLIFKGVVFNEMKRSFTDYRKIFSHQLQSKLLPDHTYAVVSGGHPLCIPDLTLEQLKKFHCTYYHPSNARFLTYGNFPLERHLQQIQNEALCKFQKREPNTAVPAQRPWNEPRECQITCGPHFLTRDASKQTVVSVAFLLPDITDTSEVFTLNLLSLLLIDGPNSPFYKALIESGLGTDFSPGVGYNSFKKEGYFSIGLQGIAETDIQTVKEIINRTFDEVIEKGFKSERIEALLQKIELQVKHQSTVFGLVLASHIASCWNHDGDPVERLQIGGQIAKFKHCLEENPQFLQQKVQQYFRNNRHKLTLSMKPDDNYNENQKRMETTKLNQKINSLSNQEKQEIYTKGLLLQKPKSNNQDDCCLPTLKVSDIEPTLPFTEFQVALAAGEIPVQLCAQPTNGMVYFRAFSSLNTLPEELKPYVPLFCNVLTKLGCGNLNARELAQQIELKTGGLTVSPQVLPDTSHLDSYEQGVHFSSLCLEQNLPDMMHLWMEIFNNPSFADEEQFKVLVKMTSQKLLNGILGSGRQYATLRASRTLTPAGQLDETFSGMDQVNLMKQIAEMTDIQPILGKLLMIKKHILNRDSMRCSVIATPQHMTRAQTEAGNFIGSLRQSKKDRKTFHPHVIEEPAFEPSELKTHFVLPFPMNFISECVRTAPFTNPDHASLKVLAHLMTAKFLHAEIREKGGAYSGGARLNYNGIFTFYSYGDPNSTETLQAFANAVDWAKSGKFTQQDIDEAKLSVFSAVDAPVAPSRKGLDHFLFGVSDEMQQMHREQLFAVTHDSLTSVSNRYLGVGKSTHGIALLGPENEKISNDPSWIRI
ncbi:presequence protease, mitochondrial-like [Ctenodactylus gundi]